MKSARLITMMRSDNIRRAELSLNLRVLSYCAFLTAGPFPFQWPTTKYNMALSLFFTTIATYLASKNMWYWLAFKFIKIPIWEALLTRENEWTFVSSQLVFKPPERCKKDDQNKFVPQYGFYFHYWQNQFKIQINIFRIWAVYSLNTFPFSFFDI